MPKYLLLKHYRDGPELHRPVPPMDQWAPRQNPYVEGSVVLPANGRPWIQRTPVRRGMITPSGVVAVGHVLGVAAGLRETDRLRDVISERHRGHAVL